MSFWRKPQVVPPPPAKKTFIELWQYTDLENGNTHWDVFRDGRSTTDDYGYQSLAQARDAYARALAIERGEIRVGFGKTLLEQEYV